jgi:hypothetical protein
VVDDLPFTLHLEVWGAHYAGDITEKDACIAEFGRTGPYDVLDWDDTAADLAHIRRFHLDVEMHVPECWALHYLPLDWQAEAL